MLLILNESNLVVGKKSVPASGARELHMELEGGSWALSSSSVKSTLATNYRLAVQRIGNVSTPDTVLSDDDLAYFLQQRRHASEMALLLPLFGQDMEDDCLDLESYEAFLTGMLFLGDKCLPSLPCFLAAEVSRLDPSADDASQGKSRCSSAPSPSANSPRQKTLRI
jgi:hypothetical protein